MITSSTRPTLFGAAAIAAAAAIAFGVFGLPVGKAEAQGIMSAPACQCSPATPIDGMSMKVAHCICGAMSCVVAEPTGQSKSPNLMQCVK